MAARQLGQLPVIAAGETLPDLADVLLDDVVVVQQPLSRGPDVLAAVGRGGEARLGILQNPAGVIETRQERRPPPAGTRVGQALLRGQGLRPLTEMLGAEQFAADRPRERSFPCVRTTSDETGEEAVWTQERDGVNLGVRAGGSAPGNSGAGWSSVRGSGGTAGCRRSARALMRAV
jgi:hypothetical protein